MGEVGEVGGEFKMKNSKFKKGEWGTVAWVRL
jgi:hypothetical protein